MVISKEAQRILVTAAEYLKDPGHWIQQTLSEGDKVCALGALRKAAIMEGLTHAKLRGKHLRKTCKPYREARRALYKTVGESIPYWNDNPARNHADIHEGFCKAVKQYVTEEKE